MENKFEVYRCPADIRCCVCRERVDYCNSVLYGASAVVIHRLQMVLNAAARLVVGLGKYEHITPVLRHILHWLPVPQRIQFKTASLHRLLTASRALGLPTSAALPAQSLTIQFHEQAWKAEFLHGSSSCLELTAASPSLSVHQSQSVSSKTQDSFYQTGLTDFSSENY